MGTRGDLDAVLQRLLGLYLASALLGTVWIILGELFGADALLRALLMFGLAAAAWAANESLVRRHSYVPEAEFSSLPFARGALAAVLVALLMFSPSVDVWAFWITRRLKSPIHCGDASLLRAAIVQRDLERLRQLIAAGADINAHAGRYGTSLHQAVKEQHLKAMTLLLNSAADVNARGTRGWTPLHGAVR